MLTESRFATETHFDFAKEIVGVAAFARILLGARLRLGLNESRKCNAKVTNADQSRAKQTKASKARYLGFDLLLFSHRHVIVAFVLTVALCTHSMTAVS